MGYPYAKTPFYVRFAFAWASCFAFPYQPRLESMTAPGLGTGRCLPGGERLLGKQTRPSVESPSLPTRSFFKILNFHPPGLKESRSQHQGQEAPGSEVRSEGFGGGSGCDTSGHRGCTAWDLGPVEVRQDGACFRSLLCASSCLLPLSTRQIDRGVG